MYACKRSTYLKEKGLNGYHVLWRHMNTLPHFTVSTSPKDRNLIIVRKLRFPKFNGISHVNFVFHVHLRMLSVLERSRAQNVMIVILEFVLVKLYSFPWPFTLLPLLFFLTWLNQGWNSALSCNIDGRLLLGNISARCCSLVSTLVSFRFSNLRNLIQVWSLK